MRIVFIDEDPDQREAYTLLLQSCFPKDENAPVVVGIEPKKELSDMSFLVEEADIVTIILDEQLKDSGVAQYFGIELASYLRTLNKKIPIYILTSYPDSDELLDGELNVEDVLNKQTISKKKEVVGARILRRIDTYLDISNEREIKFEDLLKKSISGKLSDDEYDELKTLGYLRSAPLEVEEIAMSEQIKKLDKIQEKIIKIEESLNKK